MLEIDTQRLFAINSLGNVMIATRANHSVVRPGDKLAGMRVIPLVIGSEHMKIVSEIADASDPLLTIHPFLIKDCTLLVTGNEVSKALIADTFSLLSKRSSRHWGLGYQRSYIR